MVQEWETSLAINLSFRRKFKLPAEISSQRHEFQHQLIFVNLICQHPLRPLDSLHNHFLESMEIQMTAKKRIIWEAKQEGELS